MSLISEEASLQRPYLFEDLVRPVVAAVRRAYDLRRVREDQDIPWTGPEVGDPELAHAMPAAERLRAEQLAYSLDDQGRDALEEIVGLAVQLGIEQGRRMAALSPEAQTQRVKTTVARLTLSRLAEEEPMAPEGTAEDELTARREYAKRVRSLFE